jgi:Uma2 family endonuclease
MKRATYQDVLNAPENKVAEILEGDLFLSPRPAPPHAVAASRVGRILGPYDDDPGGPGGWWILDEPELHLDDDVFSLAPDWVCEVLSPATEKIDRGRKLRIYAAAGVQHAWLLKPLDRTLEVLHLRDGAWTIVGVCSGSDVVRIKPFEAIEVSLARLWADEAPAPSAG